MHQCIYEPQALFMLKMEKIWLQWEHCFPCYEPQTLFMLKMEKIWFLHH